MAIQTIYREMDRARALIKAKQQANGKGYENMPEEDSDAWLLIDDLDEDVAAAKSDNLDGVV